MIKTGIYKITAIHSGEFYIGSSNDIRVRWNRHKCDLRKNIHGNKHLQNIYNKYGKDCFVFEIIELTTKDMLIQTEQKYLDNLKPQLNIRPIAELNLGLKHTEEAKIKMSKAKLGKKASLETKAKLSEMRKGKSIAKQSEESKLANARRQAKLTDFQVWQIKWLSFLGLSSNEIARCFDIDNSVICKIVKNKKKAYCHVKFNPSMGSIG